MSDKNKDFEDQDENLNQGNGGDDFNDADENFGLPDFELKPLEETESDGNNDPDPTEDPEKHSQEHKEVESESDEYEEEYKEPEYFDPSTERNDYSTPAKAKSSSKGGIIIFLVIFIIVIGGGGFAGYKYWWVPRGIENAKFEKLVLEADSLKDAGDMLGAKAKYQEALQIKPKQENLRLEISQIDDFLEEQAKKKREEEARKQAELAAQRAAEEAKPKTGSIEIIESKTGRYYIVVASDIDDDLAMDFAKNLSKSGTSSKIIKPVGKNIYHRVTVGDYETFSEAQGKADELKGTYGNNIWVVKH
ncbi:MAG: SPOR domain-containing protein [Cyclobacteriaceae bacterium]|nr:SPOR domain-containing protein [Cyclobacteriaceae bacterium]